MATHQALPTAVRALLADDQRLILAALRELASAIPGVRVEGEATDLATLAALATAVVPDLILMEAQMGGDDCVAAIARIKSEIPACRIVIVSARRDEALVRRAIAAGISGYVLKQSPPEELRFAVDAVMQGGIYLFPGAWRSALHRPRRTPRREALSPRQREVLTLIAQGICTKHIARCLGLSVKTVETHRAALMARLQIPHVAGLVVYALRHNLVTLET